MPQTPNSRSIQFGAAPAPPWPEYKHVIFDCDATLAAIEGIDELASPSQRAVVESMTDSAMAGEVDLGDIYADRLALLDVSRRDVWGLREAYRSAAVPGCRAVVRCLRELGHEVYVVSGGLAEPVIEFSIHLGVDPDNVRAVHARYDRYGGAWWESGSEFDAAVTGYEPCPLSDAGGKATVIRELLADRQGRSLLVGDGITDLHAAEAVDFFVGFGGIRFTERVAAEADAFIHGPDLRPVIALAAGPAAQARLEDPETTTVFADGLAALRAGDVQFRESSRRDAFTDAAAHVRPL